MRSQLKFVITAALLCHLFLAHSLVTSQTLPSQTAETQAPADQSSGCHVLITSPPSLTSGHEKAATPAKKQPVHISEAEPVEASATECERNGDLYTLHGNVEIKFDQYTFHGENVTYNAATADAEATGGAALNGGPRDIHVLASHATYNTRSRTGKFYDVTGSTGARFKGRNVTLTSSNPIVFTGRMVEQTGQEEYVIHHGSVTSCEVPHPKWTFNAETIVIRIGMSAKVHNSTFRLKGVPVLYIPYASPPVERLGRQSGFLIPNFGTSSTKGTIIGDSFYWAINRSMDATVGAEYLSKRGWSLQENFRAKPSDTSYLNLNYFQVLDRGIVGKDAAGNPITQDQGGEDIKLNGEAIFPHDVRGVASLNYLSSFIFRLAFTENFSQAVDSEVKSTAFLTKSIQGFSFNGFVSRYQNFQSSTDVHDVITILHTPGVELSSVDHRMGALPLYWSYDVAGEGLRRSEPSFVTKGLVGRFDVNPDISLPLDFDGWTFRPEVQLRNTIYTQEQVLAPGNSVPTPTDALLDRRTITGSFEFRPPALAKTFEHAIAGRKIRHTIEPRLVYRYTNGVENFASVIHFDFRDIVSNTNEAEIGLTQRLFARDAHSQCEQQESGRIMGSGEQAASAAALCAPAGADEFLTWEVKVKYFADPNFGGAIVNGRRNVLDTTVDFTPIAFLTDPRRFSPLVSRLRLRTTANSDLEWQLDYDSKKGQINSSTFYTTLHFGNWMVQGSHAFLRAPGEIVFSSTTPPGVVPTPLPVCTPGIFNTAAPCVPQVFNQLRALIGYGSPSKRGWSAAVNAGVDSEFNLVQYTATQAGYNWDCCGINLEYRRFSLGPVRNENQYRFSFTLANIGSFGNMKRQTRVF